MKKLFAALLSVIMLLSMSVPAFAAGPNGWEYGERLNYEPRPNASTYKPSSWTTDLVDKYQVKWYEDPAEACLKGEVMLVQLRVIQEALKRQGYTQLKSNIELGFKDVGMLVPPAVEEARVLKAFGILSGDTSGNMKMESVVTRAEVAKILTIFNQEILEMYGVNEEVKFRDVKSSHWASGYISYVQQIGLMGEVSDNKFYPESAISIEQMLQILDREVGTYGIERVDIAEAMNDTFKCTMNPGKGSSSTINNVVTGDYTSYNIVKGEEKTIQLYISPYTSKDIEVESYDSSTARVVSVNQNNDTVRIKGVSTGSVYIKVKVKGASDKYATLIAIYVNKSSNIPVTSITLRDKLTLNEGETYKLNANVYPSNATDKTVNWYSDDKSIAKIDSNGKVTAVGSGATVITAQTNSGHVAYCVVTVKSNGGSSNPDYPTDDGRSFIHANGYGESTYYNAFNNESINFIVDTDKSVSSVNLSNNNCTLTNQVSSHTDGYQFTVKTATLSQQGECLITVNLSNGETITVNVVIYP